MATKLNWTYDDASGEHRAMHNGFRIRAVRDDDAQNPLTDGDMNWPIVVRNSDRNDRRYGFTSYKFGKESNTFACPIACFTDPLLDHWQMRIAKEFGSTPRDLIECYGSSTDALPEGKHRCRDMDVLRDVLTQTWDDWADSSKFDTAVELLKMADITALSTTVTGYSQGDWAEVLVVATPGAIEKFGCTEPVKPEDLQATADLYGAWAWGDVYGYIIERPDVCVGDPDDPDEIIWEEIPDGACWGFYGADFDKSGLEEAALEACPDMVKEPVDAQA